jgi:hypothetical protein
MFGHVNSLVASDDRIYVLDTQIPTVRVYDDAGIYIGDIGETGQGPGEFTRPDNLAIGPDGALYVRSGFEARLTIFEPSGELRDTWPIEGGAAYSQPTVVTDSGEVFLPGLVAIDSTEPRRRIEMIPWGPNGAAGPAMPPPEIEVDPQRVSGIAPVRPGGLPIEQSVPFAPGAPWAFGISSAFFAGSSADYSFEITLSDGKVIRVSRFWEPVAVLPDEARWHKAQMTADMRQLIPNWKWNGPDVPATKPAFRKFIPTQDGAVWLLRDGPGELHQDCDPVRRSESSKQCWRSSLIIDAFGEDGRYLGQIAVPEGFREWPAPFVRGNLVFGVVEDDAGTIMVKRYRLVLPGEE